MEENQQQPLQQQTPEHSHDYPVRFDVDYSDKLSRVTTFFRVILVIPIVFLFLTVAGSLVIQGTTLTLGAGGLLFLGPLLMILFRKHYPKWWFNWNVELTRFQQRITAYIYCITDKYPSVEGNDSPVHFEVDYPEGKDLMRGLPLVKWFLAIPHFVVLAILGIFTLLVLLIGWISVIIVGYYPRSLFNYMVGYLRWALRVYGYAFLLVTDKYPPFSFKP